jgi:hypothetical protein
MSNNAEVVIIIKTLDQSTKETKKVADWYDKLTGTLKDVGKFMGVVTAGTIAFGLAAKKAFDLGKEGAQIIQLSASAEALGVDLESLRKASNNTISDFALLNATQTLLIGTSGDLKQAFLDNSNQLLAIAKAANKVNPALGDTDFLYQSIATGIKRSSPLILDNLGLVVKVGAANEAYAESLGKTVGELTAQEKQMALLNATLEAGNELIAQADQVSENSVDVFTQLETAVTNLANAYKSQLSVALKDTAEGFTELVNQSIEDIETKAVLIDLFNRGIITGNEYLSMVKNGAISNREAAEATAEQNEALLNLLNNVEEVIPELENQFNEMEDGAVTTEDLTDGMNDLAMSEGNVSDKAIGAKQSLQEFFDSLDRSKLDVFQEGLDALEFKEIGGGEVVKFADNLESFFNAGIIGAEELEEGFKAGLVAEQALKVSLGDTSAWEAAALVSKELEIGPSAALALVQDLDGAIKALPDYKSIFIDIIKSGSGAGVVSSGGGSGINTGNPNVSFEEGQATGGSFLVPGSGGTDSQFVGFMATPGEQVTVQTPGQQGSENVAGVTNNFNGPVTISSSDTELLMTMGLDISGARVP